jgi:hypothetical protein
MDAEKIAVLDPGDDLVEFARPANSLKGSY